MSHYRFTPAYSYEMGSNPYVCWNGGFSDEELQNIIEIGDKMPHNKATIGKASAKEDISHYRRSNVAWLKEGDCPWLYARMSWICQQLNGRFYDFDLWGFAEDMQYTVYDGTTKGYYDWHIDAGEHIINNIDNRLPRKLSLVVQLTDPKKYKGGELHVKNGRDYMVLPNDKGVVLAFPSYSLHRVTPVTSGIRKSLVVWVTGPRFR